MEWKITARVRQMGIISVSSGIWKEYDEDQAMKLLDSTIAFCNRLKRDLKAHGKLKTRTFNTLANSSTQVGDYHKCKCRRPKLVGSSRRCSICNGYVPRFEIGVKP